MEEGDIQRGTKRKYISDEGSETGKPVLGKDTKKKKMKGDREEGYPTIEQLRSFPPELWLHMVGDPQGKVWDPMTASNLEKALYGREGPLTRYTVRKTLVNGPEVVEGRLSREPILSAEDRKTLDEHLDITKLGYLFTTHKGLHVYTWSIEERVKRFLFKWHAGGEVHLSITEVGKLLEDLTVIPYCYLGTDAYGFLCPDLAATMLVMRFYIGDDGAPSIHHKRIRLGKDKLGTWITKDAVNEFWAVSRVVWSMPPSVSSNGEVLFGGCSIITKRKEWEKNSYYAIAFKDGVLRVGGIGFAMIKGHADYLGTSMQPGLFYVDHMVSRYVVGESGSGKTLMGLPTVHRSYIRVGNDMKMHKWFTATGVDPGSRDLLIRDRYLLSVEPQKDDLVLAIVDMGRVIHKEGGDMFPTLSYQRMGPHFGTENLIRRISHPYRKPDDKGWTSLQIRRIYPQDNLIFTWFYVLGSHHNTEVCAAYNLVTGRPISKISTRYSSNMDEDFGSVPYMVRDKSTMLYAYPLSVVYDDTIYELRSVAYRSEGMYQ